MLLCPVVEMFWPASHSRVFSRKVNPDLQHIWPRFCYCSEIFKQETSGSNRIVCLLSNREYRPRENVTFLENGTKVFALNPKSFVFVREKSAGDPEVDIVRTINIPYVVRLLLNDNLSMVRNC